MTKKGKKQTGESPANRSILRITYGIALLFLALILYVGYFIPVSYTHLDVYKRQG